VDKGRLGDRRIEKIRLDEGEVREAAQVRGKKSKVRRDGRGKGGRRGVRKKADG